MSDADGSPYQLGQKETDLQFLINLRDNRPDNSREWIVRTPFPSTVIGDSQAAQSKLKSEGFDSDAALEDTIKKLDSYIKKAKKKDADGGAEEEPQEDPSWPLLEVPDAEVTAFSKIHVLYTGTKNPSWMKIN